MRDTVEDRSLTHSARWPALVVAVERLAETRTLEAVIAVVRETARAISGADGVTFVLRDGNFCHYIEESAIAPLWKGKRFPLTACISGWCMLNGETATIPDIYADRRIPFDAYRPTFVKSLVMVPVGRPESFAAIGCYWAERRNFVPEDVSLIEALARSTAAAIAMVTMRDAMRDSEERLSVALAAGRLGAFEWELWSERLVASAETKAHFGRDRDAPFSPTDLIASVHADDRERVVHAIEEARAAGTELGVDFRAIWPDGSTHWTELRGRVVRDEYGAAMRMTGVSLDVTRRKLNRERIERLQSDLAHAGRLNELGETVSTVAHELKQPLAAARNYLGAARRLLAKGAEAGRVMEGIVKADGQFARASAIVERIRGFAAKHDRSAVPENAAALIGEAVELSLIDVRFRRVRVRVEAGGDLPPVLADKVQVHQVLLNLLRNAYEAADGVPKPRVCVSASVAGDENVVAFRIADNGPGLAPEIAERLFQPFATTKANGMGVGLSICRTLIEGHGGRMWHEPGAPGATFVFTLPRAEG